MLHASRFLAGRTAQHTAHPTPTPHPYPIVHLPLPYSLHAHAHPQPILSFPKKMYFIMYLLYVYVSRAVLLTVSTIRFPNLALRSRNVLVREFWMS